MILYFSGTGNSRYTARAIQAATGDDLVSMSKLIKNGGAETLRSVRPFVFVAPTYAWRMPRVLSDWIKETRFEGTRQAYFVLTCGDGTGNAAHFAKKLCKAKELEFMGLASIVMPENYIALYDTPDKTQSVFIIRNAESFIAAAAAHIKAAEPLPAEKTSLIGRLQSGIVNPVFYKTVVSAKGFRTTDACRGCGKCTQMCPLGNVRMADERPVWGKDCTHCMACICGCGNEAIEYKTGSVGRQRYFNTEEPAGF